MSSSASEPRVDLELSSPSLRLVFVLGVHVVAWAVTAGVAIAPWLRALTALAIGASLLWNLAVQWRWGPSRALTKVTWFEDGRWLLDDARASHDGQLVDYFLGTHLIALKFHGHPAVLFWGAADHPDAIRRLRVRLRHGRVRIASSGGLWARIAGTRRTSASPPDFRGT